jgi:hypothetical protein
MILGLTLDGRSSAASTYFSPWLPRGGNLARFTCQVFASEGLNESTSPFEIFVETKNSEDPDRAVINPQGGGTGKVIALTPLALTAWEVGANLSSGNTGFLELVRFRYRLTPVASTEPWVHFRVLNPVWLAN